MEAEQSHDVDTSALLQADSPEPTAPVPSNDPGEGGSITGSAESSDSDPLSDSEDEAPYAAVVDGWARLMGDDVRLKSLGCADPDSETAAVQSDVCCSFTMAPLLADGEVGEVLHSMDNAVFRIGAGDTIPALELGLRYSRAGDEFLLRTSTKFAYGSKGLVVNNKQVVPPDCELELHVNVHSIVESVPPAEMSVEQIEHELGLRKTAGNRLLTEGEPQRALRCYGQCLKMLEGSELDMTKPELGGVRKLIIDMLNNTAMVHLQMKEYRKAKDSCISVLEIDPDNVKALYRAGKAAIYTADYDEAEAALRKALEFEPNDAKILAEYRELKLREKAYNQNSKQMFQSMSKHLFTPGQDVKPAEPSEQSTIAPAPAPQAPSKPQAEPSDAANFSLEGIDPPHVEPQPATQETTEASTHKAEPTHAGRTEATQTTTSKQPSSSWLSYGWLFGIVIAILVAIFQNLR